jgi:hypothetical protein
MGKNRYFNDMATQGTPQGARKTKVTPILPPAPVEPHLPEYLRIAKLSPQKIKALPVNQQTLAEHLFRLRQGDATARRFLRQWTKRLPNGAEKTALTQILNSGQQ